jgi:hypothetical protein
MGKKRHVEVEEVEEKDRDILETTKRAVLMTPDMKCILRGSGPSSYMLFTLDEKSRRKIKLFANKAGAKNALNSYCCSRFLRVSDDVVKLYNIDRLNNRNLPELIPVSVETSVKILG